MLMRSTLGAVIRHTPSLAKQTLTSPTSCRLLHGHQPPTSTPKTSPSTSRSSWPTARSAQLHRLHFCRFVQHVLYRHLSCNLIMTCRYSCIKNCINEARVTAQICSRRPDTWAAGLADLRVNKISYRPWCRWQHAPARMTVAMH